MTEPAPMDNMNCYLAALNDALVVGMQSRSRILEEAGEHLNQTALGEHEKLVAQIERRELPGQPNAALWAEAQRRAIAAFGAPDVVAAGFQHGPLGALDKRLALTDAWFERWLWRRPVMAGTIWAAATSLAWVALGAAISVVGELFGVGYATNVLMLFVVVGVLSFCIRIAGVLRGRLGAGGVAVGRGLPLWQPKWFRMAALRDWHGYLFFQGYVLLTVPTNWFALTAAWIGLALAVELLARLARRAGRGAGWAPYGTDPEENWSHYTTGLGASAGITLALILVLSSASGLAAALGILLVGATGTTAFVRRLAWNSSVKRNWGRTYELRAAAAR